MADGDDDSAFGEGLQVELFHPETDREPGDTNWEGYGFDVHPQVFFISAFFILGVIATALIWPDELARPPAGLAIAHARHAAIGAQPLARRPAQRRSTYPGSGIGVGRVERHGSLLVRGHNQRTRSVNHS